MPLQNIEILQEEDNAVRVHEYMDKFEKYGINVTVSIPTDSHGIRVVEMAKPENTKFVTRIEVVPPDPLDNVLALLYKELK